MENTSKIEPLPKREVFYYRRRFVNRVFSALAKFFAQEAESHGATKSVIAKRLGVDPAQITRWLAHPSNLTLESISDILLALEAEAESIEIVSFRDRTKVNYAHPLIASALNLPATDKVVSVTSISAGDSNVPTLRAGQVGTIFTDMAAAE